MIGDYFVTGVMAWSLPFLFLSLVAASNAFATTNTKLWTGSECDPACNLGIVESIPENLTYPSGSPSHLSTYKAWMKLMETAKESLDIASYYWTLRGHGTVKDPTDKDGWDVFNEMVNISSRGVKIRIVQNPPNEEYPDLDSLALEKMGAAEVQNINFTALVGSGILHTKLWVVDQKHFYVGSANMDWRSLTQVKELGLLAMDCECLAQDAQKLFDVYWYLSGPGAHIPNPWPSEYTADFNLSHPASVSINGTPGQVFWASSPPPFCPTGRTGDITALLHVINSATKFVYVAVMDYFPALIYKYPNVYWPTIDDALRSAAYTRGLHVRVMGSLWNHTFSDMPKYFKSLAAINDTGSFHGTIEVKFFVVPPLSTKDIPYTRVNHNKYMVTDNAAYIGTSNWSGDYFVDTGGVSCIVNQTSPSSSTVQQELLQVFERDWNSRYTVNV